MLARTGRVPVTFGGEYGMQSARPRDVGMLVLVVGLFLVLLVISLAFGSPVVR